MNTSQCASMLNSDSPDENDDDPFGRSAFAAQLAQYLQLTPQQESVVLGLEGEWGGGKTWVIERIRRLLAKQQNPHVVVINFNPWLIGSESELIAAFMDELAAQIMEHANGLPAYLQKAKKLAASVAAYGEKLSYLKYLKYVPGVSGIGQFVEDHEKVIKEGTQKLQHALAENKPSLSSARKAIETALKEFDLPIVVIIDDLDRLRKHEIQTMIQLVKAVGNFKGVSYLLAYDSKYVAQAISHDGTLASGFAYLEKIVQLACHLPPLVPWIYRDWLGQKAQQFVLANGVTLTLEEQQEFDAAIKIATRLLRHPRDAYRWLNRLRWVYASIGDALNFCDLLVIEALQIVTPESIRALVKAPQFVFPQYDKHFFDDKEAVLAEPAPLEEWREVVAQVDDVQRALVYLLPQFAHPHFSFLRDEDAQSNRRLQTYQHWLRYLNLSSIPGQRDAAYALKLLANPEHYGRLEKQFEGVEEFAEFCHTIFDYLSPQNVADPAYFLACFCRTAQINWQSSVTRASLRRACACIDRLLDMLPDEEAHLQKIVEQVPLSLSGYLLDKGAAESAEGKALAQVWIARVANDERLQCIEKDHGFFIMRSLAQLHSNWAARKMMRAIIQKKRESLIWKCYEDKTLVGSHLPDLLQLFELLPNRLITLSSLQRYHAGSNAFLPVISALMTPNLAEQIAEKRSAMAKKLLLERKQKLHRLPAWSMW